MRCSCGGSLHPVQLDDFDLSGLTALGEVRVKGVDGLVCNRCQTTTLSGKTIARMETALVLLLLRCDRRLLGNEVRYLREWIGLSQTELAHRLDLDPEALVEWEKGEQPVSRGGSYVVRSAAVGHLLDQSLLPLGETQQLAVEVLRAAPSGIPTVVHDPYVITGAA